MYPDEGFYVFHENSRERDGERVTLSPTPGLREFDIFDIAPWLDAFIAATPFATCHLLGTPGSLVEPEYWNRNSVFWFRKVIAMYEAMQRSDAPLLIWVDCDCMLLKPFDERFFAHVQQFDVCSLRRPNRHTETGFIVFNLQRRGRDFIEALYAFYRSEGIFKEPRWDDCHAFDCTAKLLSESHSFGFLTPEFNAPFSIYEYIKHLKGPLRHERDPGVVQEAHADEAREFPLKAEGLS